MCQKPESGSLVLLSFIAASIYDLQATAWIKSYVAKKPRFDLEAMQKSCYKSRTMWNFGKIRLYAPSQALVIGVCLMVLLPALSLAQSAWYEGHEDAAPSWQEAGGNVKYTIARHQRVGDDAHTGKGCEHIKIVGQNGTYVHFSHAIDNPSVIPELLPSVWVKSDRAGLQILARVVLPRTQDPRTGRPITTLVQGTSYTQVGRWQQLRIEQIPLLLSRAIRVLRMQMTANVDSREAFVDRILLNVYGGPGETNAWIDDLDIAGHVAHDAASVQSVTPQPPAAVTAESSPATLRNMPAAVLPPAAVPPTTVSPATMSPAAVSPAAAHRIELVESVLQVDGSPVFPLAVEYRGESLVGLKELGFNTIWLEQPPTREFLGEIAKQGLWAVCPPPYPPEEEGARTENEPPKRIGDEYRAVLVWDLGVGKCDEDVDLMRRWARQIRAADVVSRRPLVCLAETNLRGFSRYADLLMVSNSPLATSLELTDYGTWLRQRPRLARPGKIIWSSVQTQPALTLEHQWSLLGREQSLPPLLGSEQIGLLAHTAIAAGSRGLLFQSRSSLDAADAATRTRAAALELLNLELKLIQPWVAVGRVASTVESNQPEVSGAVLRLDRSWLLLPIWTGPGAQFVPGQSAAKTISFVIPGVPDSHRAYEISPGGMSPVRRQERVTGGMQVTLDEFSLSRPILLTEDAQVTAAMTERTRQPRLAQRAAELYRVLAASKMQVVEDVASRLASRPQAWKADNYLSEARKYLVACDAQIAGGNHQGACIEAQRAMRMLRIVERNNWQTAVKGLHNPVAGPATVCFSTIPWHWHLVEQTRNWQLGMNFLPVGDFEDVQSMIAAGWRHMQHKTDGVAAQAEVVAAAAHSGNAGLRLAAAPQDQQQPTLIESPPVWLTSPPLNVEAGSLVRIQGWVQIPQAITGSVDGLLIFDSLSGQPLAARIGETAGWQPFTLYRVITQSGQMSVTFALSGLGEAWIDDVMVQVLGPGT